MVKEILLLGDERLYQTAQEISREELGSLAPVVQDLHDTLMAFREKHGAGRGIAAPQIGVPKRLIYVYLDRPFVFIDPRLEFPDGEKMQVLDDCMSFPGLKVRVERYKRCRIHYRDMEWNECMMLLEGDLAELLQHEYDHLDGILATMRAESPTAFVMNRTCNE